jgi:hypothetical protein
MVSLTNLSIIGVGILITFVIIVIISEIDSATPNKIWVSFTERSCYSAPTIEYLETRGMFVHDIKKEFKRELVTFCEACSCTTGNVQSYLISKKDVSKWNSIVNQR